MQESLHSKCADHGAAKMGLATGFTLHAFPFMVGGEEKGLAVRGLIKIRGRDDVWNLETLNA